MRKLLSLFFALLFATPSLAVVVTDVPTKERVTVSFVNGDTADSSAFANNCQTWLVSFDLGGGSAAATIYGMSDPTLATGASGTTALTNGTLTAASLAAPVSVSTALPYLKVDVVTGPSSGTARVFLYCVKLAGGGGVGGGSAVAVHSASVYGQNMPLTVFSANTVLQTTAGSQPAAYSTAAEHTNAEIAAGAAGATVTPLEFLCWWGNGAGSTGTGNWTLAVFEDGNDATPETIATISFALATDDETIKRTTTFATITSTPPFFFVVRLADGGSATLVNTATDSMCRFSWATT